MATLNVVKYSLHQKNLQKCELGTGRSELTIPASLSEAIFLRLCILTL